MYYRYCNGESYQQVLVVPEHIALSEQFSNLSLRVRTVFKLIMYYDA